MALIGWLDSFFASSSPRSRRPARLRYLRPRLEQLEQRTLLAIVTWDGGGGDFNWNNPVNWSSNVIPGGADDVTINIAGHDAVIAYSGPGTTIRSLVNSEHLVFAGNLTVIGATNNGGVLETRSGMISLGNGGVSTGEFRGDVGTTYIFGGVHELAASSVVDAANVEFRTNFSTVTTFYGRYTARESTKYTNIGYVTLAGEILDLGDEVYTSGTLALSPTNAGPLTIDNLMLESGVYTNLIVDADLEILDHFQWNSGVIGGSGHIITRGSSTVRAGSLDAAWENYGQAEWLPSWSLFGGGTLHNHAGAVFDTKGDAVFALGGLHATVINEGTFRKSAGAGEASTRTFHNHGVVELQSGTLHLREGGVSTGEFLGAAGTTFIFGGVHELTTSSVVDAANVEFRTNFNTVTTFYGRYTARESTKYTNIGYVTLAGEILDLGDEVYTSGALALSPTNAAPLTIDKLTLESGVYTNLFVDADLEVLDHFQWNAGTIGGSGHLVTRGSTTVRAGSLDTTWDNYGQAEWLPSWSLFGGGTLHNHAGAVFDTKGDAVFALGGLHATVINEGTFRKSAGTGEASTRTFHNHGLVEVQSGTLYLREGVSTGEFLGAADTTFIFGGVHELTTSSVVDAANVEFRTNFNTVTTFYGRYTARESTKYTNIGYVTLAGEILDLGDEVYTSGALGLSPTNAAPLTTTNLTLESGVYTNLVLDSDLEILGHLQWNGAPISGSGHLITRGSTQVSSGTLNTTWDNYGEAEWTHGWTLGGSGTLHNHAGAEFEFQGNGGYGGFLSLNVLNEGTFLKVGGAGSATIGALQNYGRVEVLSGQLVLNSNYLQTSGQTILNGGSIQSNTLIFQGGELAGSGNVFGNVVMAGGELSPGASPGAITLHGNYVQQSGAAFEVELAGTAGGTEYDQLIVNGAVNLGGTLDLTFLGDYEPTANDEFVLIANDGTDAVVGTFSGLADGTEFIANRHRFVITYQSGDGNDVVLTSLGPEVFYWDGDSDGDGDGVNWNDALNWAGDALPGPDDDVVIDLGGNSFTVTLSTVANVRSVSSHAPLSLVGGRLTVASESWFAALELVANSALLGTGDVTIDGPMIWRDDSDIIGPRTVTVNGSLDFNLTDLGATMLITNGVTTWGGQGAFLFDGARWINHGELRLGERTPGFGSGVVVSDYPGSGLTRFVNHGTIVHTGSEVATFSIPAENHGDVRVGSGGLSWGAASSLSSSSGSFLSEGSRMEFIGNQSFTGPSAIQGATVAFRPVTISTVAGDFDAARTEVLSGQVDFAAPDRLGHLFVSIGRVDTGPDAVTLDALTLLSSARLMGSGDVTVSGPAIWREDSDIVGLRTVTMNGDLDYNLTDLGQTTLVTNGVTTWGGQGAFLFDGARWINHGELRLGERTPGFGSGVVLSDYPGTGLTRFINHGTILHQGSELAIFSIPGENHGQVLIESGGLVWGTGNVATSSSGSFSSDGPRLVFGGKQTFTATSSVQGATVVFQSVGDSTVSGDFSADRTEVVSGHVAFEGPDRLGHLFVQAASVDTGSDAVALDALTLLDSARLMGSGDVSVSGPAIWREDSDIVGSRTVTMNGDLDYNLTDLGATTLVTNGVTTWGGQGTFLFDGARWINYGELRLGERSPGFGSGVVVSDYPGTGLTRFINHGEIVHEGSELATFSISFENHGAVESRSSAIHVGNAFRQYAGLLLLDGGDLVGNLDIQGGAIAGRGEIFGSVTSAGHINPGSSPGEISLHGDFTQTVDGELSMQLRGLQGGVDHDRLTIDGEAILGGLLSAALIDGFTPQLGDMFTIIDRVGSSPTLGDFVGLPDEAEFVADSHRFRIDYQGGDGNDVVLTSLGPDNSPPVAMDGALSTDEDVVVIVDLRAFVTDAESADEDLIYTIVSVSSGELISTATSGVYSFEPAENFYGDVFVSYYVSDDGELASETKTVTIHVVAIDDLPVAQGASLMTDEDSFVEIDLRTLVQDVGTAIGDLTFSVASGAHGTVTLIDGHTARYWPDVFFQALGDGEIGMDAFEFLVSDGDGGTATAIVEITVEGRNDAPLATTALPDVTVDQNAGPSVIDLTGLFADVDASDVLTITASSSSTSLVTATVVGNTLTLEYLANQYGTATITVTATDPQGAMASVSFSVRVLSPEEQAEEVVALIHEWQSEGQVNSGQANSLNKKIENALTSYANGNVTTAENQLGALKNQIRALVRPGGLTQADADLAIALIDGLIASLRP